MSTLTHSEALQDTHELRYGIDAEVVCSECGDCLTVWLGEGECPEDCSECGAPMEVV